MYLQPNNYHIGNMTLNYDHESHGHIVDYVVAHVKLNSSMFKRIF